MTADEPVEERYCHNVDRDFKAICGQQGRYSATNGWMMVDCPACLEIGPDAATWTPDLDPPQHIRDEANAWHARNFPSPSVPVESREQPSGEELREHRCFDTACLADGWHRHKDGGRYWTPPSGVDLLAERDATIRELRAKLLDANARLASQQVGYEQFRAERDRARDLAAHLEAEVAHVAIKTLRDAADAFVADAIKASERYKRRNPTSRRGERRLSHRRHATAGIFSAAVQLRARAAHLEAEQAETEEH